MLAMALAFCTLSISSIAMAAIVVGASTTAVSDHVTYTNLTLDTPSSVSAGDVMIASIVVNGGSAVGITPPSGWTQIARTDNDVNVTLVTYWKAASASEPSSYSWVLNTQTRAVGGITRYSGVSTTNPIDASSGNTGFSNSATTTSVATADPNEEVVAIYGTDVNKTLGTPAGMTQEYAQTHTTLGPTIAANDVLQTAAGSSGVNTSSIDPHASRYWVAQQIALRSPSPGIAFDNDAIYNASGPHDYVSNLSFPYTVINDSNGMLILEIEYDTMQQYSITGVTYDGVPLIDSGYRLSSPSVGAVSVWYMFAPPAGNHTIVVSASTPSILNAIAVSYTGVRQSGFPDASGIGNPQFVTSSYHLGESVTTVADNSWVIMPFTKSGGSIPIGDSGTTVRLTANPYIGNISYADSNGPIHPAGAYSIGATAPDLNNWAATFFSIAPAD